MLRAVEPAMRWTSLKAVIFLPERFFLDFFFFAGATLSWSAVLFLTTGVALLRIIALAMCLFSLWALLAQWYAARLVEECCPFSQRALAQRR